MAIYLGGVSGIGYRIAGGKDDRVHMGLVASELVHRYLLIHDDIIDRDLVRHSERTIEKIYLDKFKRSYPKKIDEMYSKGMAIVAGDIVNAMTYELLTRTSLSNDIIVAAIKGINRLMMETGAGWQLQTEQNFQNIYEVTEDAFMKGMILVSAQYSVVWPLRMGQIFAGRLTQDTWDPYIEKYGLDTGIAFQLVDDLLGMFGDEKTTGKPSGHDYREGKKTFLLLKAYSHANDDDKQFLAETLGTDITGEQLGRVRQIMTDTFAVKYVKEKADYYARSAQEALKSIKTNDHEAVDLLSELADLLANRDY
jgi:geranylgeranyl diphosphate synthase type I